MVCLTRDECGAETEGSGMCVGEGGGIFLFIIPLLSSFFTQLLSFCPQRRTRVNADMLIFCSTSAASSGD